MNDFFTLHIFCSCRHPLIWSVSLGVQRWHPVQCSQPEPSPQQPVKQIWKTGEDWGSKVVRALWIILITSGHLPPWSVAAHLPAGLRSAHSPRGHYRCYSGGWYNRRYVACSGPNLLLNLTLSESASTNCVSSSLLAAITYWCQGKKI